MADAEWYSWGYNGSAQVGRDGWVSGGSNPPLLDAQPTSFPAGVEIVQIACSENAGVGVSSEGDIYVWGLSRINTTMSKFGGQFDPATNLASTNPPTQLTYPAASNAVEVAQTNGATFWRKSDGTVWGVGRNGNGEFGNGEAIGTYHATPIQLTGLPAGIARIYAWVDGWGLFAIDSDTNLWFSGRNQYAMDGTGIATPANHLTFVQVAGLLLPDPSLDPSVITSGAYPIDYTVTGTSDGFWAYTDFGTIPSFTSVGGQPTLVILLSSADAHNASYFSFTIRLPGGTEISVPGTGGDAGMPGLPTGFIHAWALTDPRLVAGGTLVVGHWTFDVLAIGDITRRIAAATSWTIVDGGPQVTVTSEYVVGGSIPPPQRGIVLGCIGANQDTPISLPPAETAAGWSLVAQGGSTPANVRSAIAQNPASSGVWLAPMPEFQSPFTTDVPFYATFNLCIYSTAPPTYLPLTGVVDVTMANHSGFSAQALLNNGTVVYWGKSMLGPTGPTLYRPTAYAGISNIEQIFGTSGSRTFYMLTTSGTVLGIGSDFDGALCNGTWDAVDPTWYHEVDHYELPPVTIGIPGGRTAAKLMRGSSATYAMFVITTDGEVWGWGLNDYMWGESDPDLEISEKVPPIQLFPDLFNASARALDVVMMDENALFVLRTLPIPYQPLRLVLDLADTLTRLYLVMMDGSAWVFTNDTRLQLAADSDGRQMAAGMVAVATAGETAFFCDRNGQLWQTGNVFRVNAGQLVQVPIDYLERIPTNANRIELMGPHGIGPSYQNETGLWVSNKNRLIGLGGHPTASLLNGLLPSSPNPIGSPSQGAYAWPSGTNPPAVSVTSFDYRAYMWKALATSDLGAYGQFAELIRRAVLPQGHMVG